MGHVKRLLYAAATIGSLFVLPVSAYADETTAEEVSSANTDFASRWHIWGFGEVSALRNFNRLGSHRSNPVEDFPAWDIHLPNAGLWIEFDCGKGWSVGTEMHLDNAGIVSMSGPGSAASRNVGWDLGYELSEFWIQKSFSDQANLKIGWMSTPVGNKSDLPTDFFGVTRPEDGPAFLPLDCSTAGIDFNGEAGVWSYEVMAIPGLTGYDFGNPAWHYGDASFEQSMSRLFAGAFCVTNSSVEGLDLMLSGQFGGGYTMVDREEEDALKINNGLSLAAFGFSYDDHNLIARGSYQYGYLSNHCKEDRELGECKYDMQGMSAALEVGYDMFSLNSRLNGNQKLYVFGRYAWNEHHNHAENNDASVWNRGQRFSVGLNWMPIPSIVVKGECGFGFGSDPTRCFAGVSVGWCPSYNIST